MTDHEVVQITKSDFLLYLESPRHLWAKKNGVLSKPLSEFTRHLIEQGYAAEELARNYFETIFIPEHPMSELIWQRTFADGSFTARTDVLVYNRNTNSYDLYEIKSATTLDKKHLYDIAYQAMAIKSQIKIDHYYLFHFDKGYIPQSQVDLSQLFIADDVTEKVLNLLPEVSEWSQQALLVVQESNPTALSHCLTPKVCPYPEVCHPGLPNFSIYDIPYLDKKKKLELLKLGILDAANIPINFGLNEKQRLVADLARTNTEHVDKGVLKLELDRFVYPLWFLDYETCISSIPKYAGYHPQQHIVFQYSLHKIDHVGGELQHTGYIGVVEGDPSLLLLEHLSIDLGNSGTIIVWNKTFEMTKNKEMANLHPNYYDFLENLNSRIYDLGEIIARGIYQHSGFKGSWSLKNVLPIMVPELTYKDLLIAQGDQASTVWWNIMFGNLVEQEKAILIEELKKYCELDTLAMVQIYRKLLAMI